MNPDRYTVFGIEKPFPWVAVGLFCAAVIGGPLFIAAAVWAVTKCDNNLCEF